MLILQSAIPSRKGQQGHSVKSLDSETVILSHSVDSFILSAVPIC